MSVAKPNPAGMTLLRPVAGLAALFACVAVLGSSPVGMKPRPSSAGGLAAAPRIILWTWERPDDLRFVDLQRMGLAFLAGTLRLENDDVVFQPRRNSVRFPPGAFLIACVRIEPDRTRKPTLSPPQRARAVQIISRVAALGGVKAVQVDFDVTVSERAFYSAMLSDLRAEVPGSIPISMTALASWCLGDDWISGLPVQEAVPMLFRMGPDRSSVVSYLNAGGDFRAQPCRGSLGLSTDEPFRNPPPGRRIYLFHTGSWNEKSVERAVAMYRGAH
jgi:hypothetical protein